MKTFVAALFLVSDLKDGDTAVQSHDLKAMDLIGSQDSRGQVAALNCQRQGVCSYYNGQRRLNNVHNGLAHSGQHKQSEFSGDTTCMALWCWLIDHVFPGIE